VRGCMYSMCVGVYLCVWGVCTFVCRGVCTVCVSECGDVYMCVGVYVCVGGCFISLISRVSRKL
jgi:hypothetical protein